VNKVAILIDFWKTVNEGIDPISKRDMKKWINDVKTKDIDTVIVATYDAVLEEWQTPVALNTKEFVGKDNWNKKIDKIRLDKVFNNRRDHITNPDVWRLTKTKKLYTIHYPWEIPAQMLENISEVYMYGQAWDICVKSRPLGYDFWLHNTKAKIMLAKDSCKFSNSTYVDYNCIPNIVKLKDDVWEMIRM
jgi:hypothetical protein